MSKKANHEGIFGLVLAAIALLVLWLMNRNGLLHETVSSGIVTGAGTISSDPATGAPQFDTGDTRTYDPAKYAMAVPPICGSGVASPYTSNPQACSCPQGTTLWKNIADGGYWCFPQ